MRASWEHMSASGDALSCSAPSQNSDPSRGCNLLETRPASHHSAIWAVGYGSYHDLRNFFVLTPERIIGAMAERRTQSRRKTVLPVKLSVGDATQLAHTVDITCSGARLGGLRTMLQPGGMVMLQRGSQKARCRVAWVRQLAPNEFQAGLECLEPENTFLGVDLSGNEGEKNVETLMTLLSKSSRSDRPHK